VTVYASWNGSTETAYWRVSAGDTLAELRPVKTVPAEGFETAVQVAGRPRHVSVTALDASHRALGVSRVLRLEG
jgi:hypothetical protein